MMVFMGALPIAAYVTFHRPVTTVIINYCMRIMTYLKIRLLGHESIYRRQSM